MCHESARYMSCAAVSQKGLVLAVTSVTLRPLLPVVRLLCTFLRVARNVLLALRSRTRLFQRFFSQDVCARELVAYGWIGRP